MMPHITATTATVQYRACPLHTTIPSVSASAHCTDCVNIRMLRFGRRSARIPAKTEKSRIGPNCNVAMRPRRNGECVSCRTSHDWVTVCIHMQICETMLPAK
jgi:hypothetical protein